MNRVIGSKATPHLCYGILWDATIDWAHSANTLLLYYAIFVLSFMNRKHRSYLAQYRCGILPLSIETGRWGSIPLEDRIFKMCDSLVVEDEYHFIFHC